LGGGSSMDTAKGCNFVLNNGGTMSDYRGYGLAKAPMLPFIAVPTTAGTGSECQSYAVVSRKDSHEKMACGDPKALARVAILDPELTLSQPPRVAALTALDAMAHALESAVSTRRNPLSQLYAKEAFRLIASGIEMVLQEAALMEHRENVLLGAAMAGLAIENSMLGAAHAAANPLTARFGIPHGEAVSLMLPSVLRFNREKSPATAVYLELSALIHEPLVEWVEQVIALAGLPGFAAAGVEESHLAELASEASKQWTGQFNPRAVTEADFMTLYAEALMREEVPV
jgi:alcohol dehydrogenase